MLTELSLLIVAYLGVFIGLLLAKVTGKEVSQGKKSLQSLRNTLFVLALAWFAYASQLPWLAKIVIIVAVLAIVMTTDMMYAATGILLGVHPEFVMSALLFLYGFPVGSFMQKKSYRDAFLGTYGFLVFAALSYAIVKLLL